MSLVCRCVLCVPVLVCRCVLDLDNNSLTASGSLYVLVHVSSNVGK